MLLDPSLSKDVNSVESDISSQVWSSDIGAILTLKIITKSFSLNNIYNNTLVLFLLNSFSITVIIVSVDFTLNGWDNSLKGADHFIKAIKFWLSDSSSFGINSHLEVSNIIPIVLGFGFSNSNFSSQSLNFNLDIIIFYS